MRFSSSPPFLGISAHVPVHRAARNDSEGHSAARPRTSQGSNPRGARKQDPLDTEAPSKDQHLDPRMTHPNSQNREATSSTFPAASAGT